MSIFQPHVRAIARRKACAAFEFGSKVSLGVVNGYCRVERLSWDPYNEGTDLKSQIEGYRKQYGRYPESVHADKNHRTRETTIMLVFFMMNLERILREKLRFSLMTVRRGRGM